MDGDLDSVDVSITRTSHVQISDETTGFHVRSLWLDSTSELTGGTLKLSARNATLQGDIQSTSLTELSVSAELRLLSGALLQCTATACVLELMSGTLMLQDSTDIQGDVLDLVVGDHARIGGTVDVDDTVTIQVTNTLTLQSASAIAADVLDISAGSIIASGEVTIVEALTMRAIASLNVTSDGELECTALMCVIQLRAHDTNVQGPLTGGDINITSTGSMSISGTISADAMGYGGAATAAVNP